jgi:hypothetical protein
VLSHLETGAKGDDDPACGHGLHAGIADHQRMECSAARCERAFKDEGRIGSGLGWPRGRLRLRYRSA